MNEDRNALPTRVGVGWNPLESLQQAALCQPASVRDSVDSTQGREHAVKVIPHLYKHHRMWWCAVGGLRREDTTAILGMGVTPGLAYSDWKRQR